jgi:spore coat polysaccharide biosynthesis protein SpsF
MNTRKPFAIINVRLNSKRLKEKILKKIKNKTILEYLINQVKKSQIKNNFIINTSKHKTNEKLINFCKKKKYKFYTGPENDLLKRTRLCAEANKVFYFVNIFSDGPLIDPEIINDIIDKYRASNYDFVSNDIKTSYPPGNEVQVIKTSAIIKADNLCRKSNVRQHSTLFIKLNQNKFKVCSIVAPKKYRRSDLNIELDTILDFRLIKKIIYGLDKKKISLLNIIKFLDNNSQLKKINSRVIRRWKKYRK